MNKFNNSVNTESGERGVNVSSGNGDITIVFQSGDGDTFSDRTNDPEDPTSLPTTTSNVPTSEIAGVLTESQNITEQRPGPSNVRSGSKIDRLALMGIAVVCVLIGLGCLTAITVVIVAGCVKAKARKKRRNQINLRNLNTTAPFLSEFDMTGNAAYQQSNRFNAGSTNVCRLIEREDLNCAEFATSPDVVSSPNRMDSRDTGMIPRDLIISIDSQGYVKPIRRQPLTIPHLQ